MSCDCEKWHYVCNNPQDTPTDNRDVLVFIGYYAFGFFDNNNNCWNVFLHDNVYESVEFEKVKAWCYIPEIDLKELKNDCSRGV